MDGSAEAVLVQIPATAAREAPATVRVAPGQGVLFGRDPHLEIVLPDPRVPRLAGRLRAADTFWLVSNLTERHTFVVDNPESAGEHIKVAPRRLDLPVPFEFARLAVLPPEAVDVADEVSSFLVFAPSHDYADPHARPSPGGADTVAAFSLDETAKYFLVLVALCEPRLRDPGSLVLPSAPEVVARLVGLPQCVGLTRAAVNFQIDYLARTKLRVRPPHGAEGKADWQREALVRLALRFDLVGPHHLELLP